MKQHTEGTIRFEGLVEGRLPAGADGDAAAKLRDWVRLVFDAGVRFNLDVTDAGFSLLPDEQAVSAGSLGAVPERTIADLLNQLLEAIGRGEVFSTLRSTEYRPGEAVQVLYAVGPEGRVDVQKRVVDANTVAAIEPMTLRQKLRAAATGLVVAAAVIGITSLFVDLPGLFSQYVGALRPVDAESIEVSADAFERYFTVEEKRIENGPKRLVLKLVRAEGYPVGGGQLDQAYAAAGGSLSQRLVVESIARGFITVLLFGEKDSVYLGSQRVWIAPLSVADAAEVSVALPGRVRVGRVVVWY